MKPEEQRIAIAEACGWKPSNPRGKWCHPVNWSMAKNGSYEVWVGRDKLPNYLHDLNAMHEAEKILTYEQKYEYARQFIDFELIFATASQRAEAFLRTLNLWTN